MRKLAKAARFTLFTLCAVALIGCTSVFNYGMVETTDGDGWSVTVKLAKNKWEKSFTLDEAQLGAFRVSADYESGEMTLTLEQGSVTKTLALPSPFDEALDVSDFSAGKIDVTVTNKAVKNAKFSIKWSGK